MSALLEYTPPVRSAAPVRGGNEMASRILDVSQQGDMAYVHHVTSLGKLTAENAWKWYNRIGEVRYGISRSARIAGYGRLKGVRVGSDGSVSREASDRSVVAQIVENIYSPFGGVRHLLERYYHLMKLPAEMHLVRVMDGDMHNGYFLLSPSELRVTTTDTGGSTQRSRMEWITAQLTTGMGSTRSEFIREIAPQDYIGRIWNPSAQYVDEVDSPMTALATECEVLHDLTETMKARLRSRFALAGILLIPSSINDANIAGPTPTVEAHQDKVLNYLITAMTRNVMNHEDALALIPILLKGEGADLDKVRHLILDSSIAETDLKLRGELISRILTGLDVQKQATEGVGDTNHWAAWAVSDEERRVAVQPDLESLCWSLTRMILWAELKKLDWPDARIRPWRVAFDLSEASVKSNVAEDFRQGWDRGAVSEEAMRRVIGATDVDKMPPEEKVRWIGIKLQDPYLATFGLEGVDIDLTKVGASGKTGPAPDTPADPPESGPGGDPGSPDDNDSDTPRSERPA